MSKAENEHDRVCKSASERTRLTYDDYRRLSGSALISWVEGRGFGKIYYAPLGVVLDRHNVVQPGILFISR